MVCFQRSLPEFNTREALVPQLPACPLTLGVGPKVIGECEKADEQNEVERNDEESFDVVLRCRHTG
jgi:hypothetical protein